MTKQGVVKALPKNNLEMGWWNTNKDFIQQKLETEEEGKLMGTGMAVNRSGSK